MLSKDYVPPWRQQQRRQSRKAIAQLESAKQAKEAGQFELACIRARAAAQLGIQSILGNSSGYSVAELYAKSSPIEFASTEDLTASARELDKACEVPPPETERSKEKVAAGFYSDADAERSVSAAGHILFEIWKELYE